MKPITHAEWIAAAEDRYGTKALNWRFRCPICKVKTSVQEWKDAGAPEGAVAFSCIGRFIAEEPAKDFARTPGANGKTQPCNYTGGGLFRLNPVKVAQGENVHDVFDFADRPLAEDQESAGSKPLKTQAPEGSENGLGST